MKQSSWYKLREAKDRISALERALELRENSEHFQWCKQRISELERELEAALDSCIEAEKLLAAHELMDGLCNPKQRITALERQLAEQDKKLFESDLDRKRLEAINLKEDA